jgi:beta-fructofuranosidase
VWKQDGKLHMLLGARTREDSRGAIMMYDSDDGYSWQMSGSVTNLEEKPFGYMWECPDRIVLGGREFLSTCPQGMAKAIESQDSTRNTCQNVHAAGYFPIDGTIVDLLHQDTERMDAKAPRPAIDEKTFVDWDYGFDFYACQSLVDENGRTMLIGWMSLPHDEDDVRAYDNPTETWRGVLTIPRVLTWCEKCGRILQAPPAEIDALRGEAQAFDGSVTLPKKCADVVIDGIEGKGTIKFGDFLELRFEDEGAKLVFTDMSKSGDRKLRQAPIDEVRNVRILVDTSVLEIFVNDGAYVFGTRFFEESDELALSHDLKAASQVWYPMDEVEVNYLVTR